jgi:Lrp/AsnC family transcriptional regulator
MMGEPKLDAIDKRILRIIQKDASISINEIAARVGLSQTPCWKRLQRLEGAGVIKRRIAVLDPIKLGLGVTVFVALELGDHSSAASHRLAANLAAIDEVMDLYRVVGDVDFILRVVVPDTAAFDDFYKRLIELMPLKNVESHFALEVIKCETAYPIDG